MIDSNTLYFTKLNVVYIHSYPKCQQHDAATQLSTVSKGHTLCMKHQPSNFETTSSHKRSQMKVRRLDNRDTKAIKIFISISFLFIFTFVPKVLFLLGKVDSFGFVYAYFINYFGNPILYLIIDKHFRLPIKKDIRTLCKCLSKT